MGHGICESLDPLCACVTCMRASWYQCGIAVKFSACTTYCYACMAADAIRCAKFHLDYLKLCSCMQVMYNIWARVKFLQLLQCEILQHMPSWTCQQNLQDSHQLVLIKHLAYGTLMHLSTCPYQSDIMRSWQKLLEQFLLQQQTMKLATACFNELMLHALLCTCMYNSQKKSTCRMMQGLVSDGRYKA